LNQLILRFLLQFQSSDVVHPGMINKQFSCCGTKEKFSFDPKLARKLLLLHHLKVHQLTEALHFVVLTKQVITLKQQFISSRRLLTVCILCIPFDRFNGISKRNIYYECLKINSYEKNVAKLTNPNRFF
jgi:hypothetical protein